MRGYIAFTKKEFTEFIRTYKMLILFSVFLLIGMLNPLTAKLIPTLLANFMPEGIEITIGEPTAFDSWVQFYKNVPQMGLIVMVIIFSGIMSQEYSKSTLINMLTKGLPRRTVILSKTTMAMIMWTISYFLCFGISYGYTAYFWSGEALVYITFAALCLWIYGLFLISLIILGSVLFKRAYGSLLFTGGIVLIQFLLNIFPKVEKYSPLFLSSRNLDLINSTIEKAEFTLPIIISLILSGVFITISIMLFNKKSI